MILIVTDSIPTPSFKRSGIFGYDDFQFLNRNASIAKMTILHRITIDRRFLLDVIKQIKSIKKQIKEIREVADKNPNIEFIPYFSIIKPFVFKEDFFILKKSKFKDEKFQTVIVHSILHTGLNVNWIKAQFSGAKVILKEHSNWLLYPKMVRYFAVRCISKYDMILINSEAARQTFFTIFSMYKKQIGEPVPAIEVDYPKFKINTLTVTKSESSLLKILTVADLLKAKGFEEAFEILKILETANVKWEWSIIGKGVFLKNIIERATQLGFLEKIKILPEVQKPALFEHMKESHIYLQLSYRETFGIAPIEAFSYYNKLIISDHINSIKELGLSSNENIFIIKNINDIAAQKEEILTFVSKKSCEAGFNKELSKINQKVNFFKSNN